MDWNYFYRHYDEWTESTQLRNISELEDLGSTAEIADAVIFLSEKAGVRLINRAVREGLVFSPEDIINLDCTLDENMLSVITETTLENGSCFSAEQIMELTCLVDEEALSRAVTAALDHGILFTADQTVTLAGMISNEVLRRITMAGVISFTAEQKEIIDCYLENSEPTNGNNTELALESVNHSGPDNFDMKPQKQTLRDRIASRQKRGAVCTWGRSAKTKRKRHSGWSVGLAIAGEMCADEKNIKSKFRIGDHIRVRYRGQEGTIIDINGPLYMVSLSDGGMVDSFYENQLERAW